MNGFENLLANGSPEELASKGQVLIRKGQMLLGQGQEKGQTLIQKGNVLLSKGAATSAGKSASAAVSGGGQSTSYHQPEHQMQMGAAGGISGAGGAAGSSQPPMGMGGMPAAAGGAPPTAMGGPGGPPTTFIKGATSVVSATGGPLVHPGGGPAMGHGHAMGHAMVPGGGKGVHGGVQGGMAGGHHYPGAPTVHPGSSYHHMNMYNQPGNQYGGAGHGPHGGGMYHQNQYQLALPGGGKGHSFSGDPSNSAEHSGSYGMGKGRRIEKLDLPGSFPEPNLFTLFLGPLSSSTPSHFLLRDLFYPCGTVVGFQREPEFCFVQYTDPRHAWTCFLCLNDKELLSTPTTGPAEESRTLKAIFEEDTERKVLAWKKQERGALGNRLTSVSGGRLTDAELEWELEKTTAEVQALIDSKIAAFMAEEDEKRRTRGGDGGSTGGGGNGNGHAAETRDPSGRENGRTDGRAKGTGAGIEGGDRARRENLRQMQKQRAALIAEIRTLETRRRVLEIAADCKDIDIEIRDVRKPKKNPFFDGAYTVQEPLRWKALARFCAVQIPKETLFRIAFDREEFKKTQILSHKVRPYLVEKLAEHFFAGARQLELVEVLLCKFLQPFGNSRGGANGASSGGAGDMMSAGISLELASFEQSRMNSTTGAKVIQGRGIASMRIFDRSSSRTNSPVRRARASITAEQSVQLQHATASGWDFLSILKEFTDDAETSAYVTERLWRMLVFEVRRLAYDHILVNAEEIDRELLEELELEEGDFVPGGSGGFGE
eukprot:g8826.t1